MQTEGNNDSLRIILQNIGQVPSFTEKSNSEVYLTLINRFAKIRGKHLKDILTFLPH